MLLTVIKFLGKIAPGKEAAWQSNKPEVTDFYVK